MDRLNVAVIGCGGISTVHIQAIRNSDQARLVAVCDIKPERVKKKGQIYQAQVFTDYRDVLDLELDAIHICTSHYTHCEIAVAAMKKGIHVLAEKPIATSLKDADEMIKTAENNSAQLGVVFQNRYNRSSIAVKDAVDNGQIGKKLGCRMAVHWFRDDSYYENSDWRGTWSKEGGGALINQSIHTIDLMQWIMGDVESLEATIGNRAHKNIEVEDVAEATLRFKNGAVGSLYATTCYSYNADILLEIHGDKGIALIEKDQAVIRIKGEQAVVLEPNQDFDAVGQSYWGVSHTTQIEEFYKSLRSKASVEIDGRAGRKALEIVRAIYRSGDQRCVVRFPYFEEDGYQPAPIRLSH